MYAITGGIFVNAIVWEKVSFLVKWNLERGKHQRCFTDASAMLARRIRGISLESFSLFSTSSCSRSTRRVNFPGGACDAAEWRNDSAWCHNQLFMNYSSVIPHFSRRKEMWENRFFHRKCNIKCVSATRDIKLVLRVLVKERRKKER